MIDSKQRFSATADLYSRYRPSYPNALIDWILQTARVADESRPARIADIGCGTGISARLLAQRGHDVVAIDPNEQMLARAEPHPRVQYRRGEAAATGLDSASVDLVVVGQAFHWFDVGPTMAELKRILTAGGWCAAFWNVRSQSPLMDRYQELLNEMTTYKTLPTPEQAIQRIETFPGIAALRGAEFDHLQELDRTGFLGRVGSSSYVAHGITDAAPFRQALDALFDRYAENGVVQFRYRAIARMWRLP